MNWLKGIGIGIMILGLLFGLAFATGLFDLEMFKFFAPKYANVEREVFENTKSYLHGVQQDLGKYYHEYQKATGSEREAIRATIQMRFAEVDANKIQNPQVRMFLTQMRGY